jgi:hypothetical protein
MIAICSELFPSSTVKRMERSREKWDSLCTAVGGGPDVWPSNKAKAV